MWQSKARLAAPQAQAQSGTGLERSHQQEKENQPGSLPHTSFTAPSSLTLTGSSPNLIYPSDSCQLSFEH